MGGTDGIAAHILEYFQLMPQRRHAYGSAKRPLVVMQADSLEFQEFPIQEEALPVDKFCPADAEGGFFFIYQPAGGIDGRDDFIKTRMPGAP